MHHYHHMQDNLQDRMVRLFLLQQDPQEDVTVRLFLLQQDPVRMDT